LDKHIRVVIADDNEDFCDLLLDFFENCPEVQIVGVAHEGQRAIQIITEVPVDVLLLDIVMPNLDGLAVLEYLHQARLKSKPRVIVLTALGQEELTRKAARFGADYYIVKPFGLSTLLQRITEVVCHKEEKPIQIQSRLELEREVASIIHQLCIPPDFKGHTYLREAVMMAVTDPTIINEITKKLYPQIAQKYGTTGGRVERAMRFAIETAWNRGSFDYLQSFFGYLVDERKGKPTNASFIAKVADQIRLELLTRK